MGRPVDVRRKRERERDEAFKKMTSLIEAQSKLIMDLANQINENKYLDTAKTGDLAKLVEAIQSGKVVNVDDDVEAAIGRPKMEEFYINPSAEINVADSNLDSSSAESKKIKGDLTTDADKLRQLLKNKKG